MCGASIDIVEGQNVVTCEFCGTTQTVHSFDNEKKNTYFRRAEALRYKCEFDKAAGVYETIVAEFPREAEAYWGLILCKYGIEYIDDPKTGLKIPTCHRTQFASIFDDSDFANVIKYADVVARSVYEKEAKEISKLQKAILDISSREDPFDIFICYKETDAKGDRTTDSVLAQNIYKELTNEGYRVFFSRITLEDKLGAQYEPYIFAALHSSKVMLHVTTKTENSEAIWVRNEWSRFLSLISEGQKKTLIPCYQGMSPYDLPDEMQNLQGQDMSKLGAMQDLLRGIDKIIGKELKQKDYFGGTSKIQTGTEQEAFESQLRKGYVYLSKKMWNDAKETFENAIKLIEKCGRAYIGLMLAEAEETSVDSFLKHKGYEADEIERLDLARSFEDEQCKKELDDIDSKIEKMMHDDFKAYLLSLIKEDRWDEASQYVDKEKTYKEEFTDIYNEALYSYLCNALEQILSVNDLDYLDYIKESFDAFEDYKESKRKAILCLEKKAKILEDYQAECVEKLKINVPKEITIKTIDGVVQKLKSNAELVKTFKPCSEKIIDENNHIFDVGLKFVENKSYNLITSLSTINDCERLKRIIYSLNKNEFFKNVLKAIEEQEIAIKDIERQIKRKKKIKRLRITGIICATLACTVAITFGIKAIVDENNRSSTFNSAKANMQNGNFDEAIKYYESLGNYKNADKKIKVCEGLKELTNSIETKKETDIISGIKKIVEAGEKVDVYYKLNGPVKRNRILIAENQDEEIKDTIESVEFELYKPSKNGYSFVNWNSTSVSYVEGKTSLSLNSNWSLDTFHISYSLDGGINNSNNAEVYTYESEDINLFSPSKNGYTFRGWKNKNEEIVTKIPKGSYGDIMLFATWEINHYSIVFKNYDDSVLYESTCDHGQTAIYQGPVPTKPSDAQFTYVFSGWNQSLENITENKEFTALFENETNSYTVTFKNYDGSILKTKSVAYGSEAIYDGDKPTKPISSDDLTAYEFIGWDVDLTCIISDTIATAKYNAVNRYLAIFKNYDGTELQSSRFNSGQIPSYMGITPTKPSDAQFTYSFSNWYPQLSGITEDTIYTAQFSNTINKYLVRFMNYDNKVLEEKYVEYGSYATFTKSTPQKPSNQQYHYDFSGWDKNPAETLITTDTDFVAQFDSQLNQYTITFKNYDGTLLSTSTVDYGANAQYLGETPKKPSDKRGYVFATWTTTNGGSQIDDLTNVIDNRTVYAKYDSVSYNKIASSRYCSNVALLTHDNKLLMFGDNAYGLATKPTGSDYSGTIPANGEEIVIENEIIIDAFIGSNYAFALTETGKIYAWGSQMWGCLGDGVSTNGTSQSRQEPKQILNTDDVIFTKMYGDSLKAAAITKDGDLYSWGSGNIGNIIDPTVNQYYQHTYPITPSKIELGFKIKDLAITNNKVAFLTKDGDIYATGKEADDYSLGTTFNYGARRGLTRISDGIIKYKKIEATSSVFMAITEDNQLYMSGTDNKGLCFDNSSSIHEFGPVLSDKKIADISLGVDHGILVDENGTISTWGSDVYGCLGNGDVYSAYSYAYTLTPLDTTNVPSIDINSPLMIKSGYHYVYVITKDKITLTWGYSYRYCLCDGRNGVTNITSPQTVDYRG